MDEIRTTMRPADPAVLGSPNPGPSSAVRPGKGCTGDSASSSVKKQEKDTVPTVTESECFMTYENGNRGTRKPATMTVNNELGTITITLKEPDTIFLAGPGYPIVIEGPWAVPKEEGENN